MKPTLKNVKYIKKPRKKKNNKNIKFGQIKRLNILKKVLTKLYQTTKQNIKIRKIKSLMQLISEKYKL
jgi:hypothetical protein